MPGVGTGSTTRPCPWPSMIQSFAPTVSRVTGWETQSTTSSYRGLPLRRVDAGDRRHHIERERANKTGRNDAAGLAQIVRTGWFKQVRIKTRSSYEIRSLLAAREVLVRIRVQLENEIRGLLRTFGVLFGKAAGGFG